ncbi:hypothetical protein IKG28_01020 [Candidatus Saccharibacteria bacterium]|nr:hypothetical protein [Candidatus Saccharibacteria bacterium]
MKYLAILGRQPEISIAELEATNFCTDIDRLGGTQKLAVKLEQKPLEFLQSLPDGKITLGVSDYSKNASPRAAKTEALKLKQILVRHSRSVRVVESKTAALSTATSLHNGLSGKNPRKIELINTDDGWYRTIGVQDIDAYTRRDQARPARDAKVGMLPPKLAQILINLCGPLPAGSRILDPFCGTGVILQEALLMGYTAYGTDLSERMIEYTRRNLKWFSDEHRDQRGAGAASPVTTGASVARSEENHFTVSTGDATKYQWDQPIDAVACEGYLGAPMSQIPTEIKLKEQKQECSSIILGFLKNLLPQIKKNTPVIIAAPAWLRENGQYERLNIIDEIENMGYNVKDISREGLLYHRDDQIVARDIIILRKK